MSLKLITPPAEEPVTVAEIKADLALDFFSSKDATIDRYISAAREVAEHEMGRSILLQTWQKTLDSFPAVIDLPMVPIAEIISLTYLDSAGVVQSMASVNWFLDDAAEHIASILPALNESWPTGNRVVVRYTAGWATPADVPKSIKQWIALHVAAWLRNPEGTTDIRQEKIPSLDGLLDRYRTWRL